MKTSDLEQRFARVLRKPDARLDRATRQRIALRLGIGSERPRLPRFLALAAAIMVLSLLLLLVLVGPALLPTGGGLR